MIVLIQLLGILIVGLGASILVSPSVTEKIFNFMMVGKRIYYAGVFRAGTGLLILLASGKSRVPIAAIALGILFLTSGLIIFVMESEKMKAFMDHYRQFPEGVMRLLGLVAASFGILIFSLF